MQKHFPDCHQKLTVCNSELKLAVGCWKWSVAQATPVPSWVRPAQLWNAHVEDVELGVVSDAVSAALSADAAGFDEDIFVPPLFLWEELFALKWIKGAAKGESVSLSFCEGGDGAQSSWKDEKYKQFSLYFSGSHSVKDVLYQSKFCSQTCKSASF